MSIHRDYDVLPLQPEQQFSLKPVADVLKQRPMTMNLPIPLVHVQILPHHTFPAPWLGALVCQPTVLVFPPLLRGNVLTSRPVDHFAHIRDRPAHHSRHSFIGQR